MHDHHLSGRAFGTMLTTNTLKKVHRTFLSYAWQQKNEDISDCTAKLISSFFYFISAILFSGFYCPFSSHFLLAGFLTQVPGLPQLSCDTLLLPCSYNLKYSDFLHRLEVQLHTSVSSALTLYNSVNPRFRHTPFRVWAARNASL